MGKRHGGNRSYALEEGNGYFSGLSVTYSTIRIGIAGTARLPRLWRIFMVGRDKKPKLGAR
jgi:hypothetical protein